jgi:hypothetical protein
MNDKFIAFIDILGFSDLVKAEEKRGGDVVRLLELTNTLGALEQTAPARICPNSRQISPDLDFRKTQISDCAVVSAEISPAGVINLAHHCFAVALALIRKGAQCRGYVTRGNIIHTDHQFIGTGYLHALENEKSVAFMRGDIEEKGTPFIQVDDVVTDYVKNESDNCVRRIFGRIVRSDGSYTAIYPFDALRNIPSAFIQSGFDPHRWKNAVQVSMRHRKENLEIFEKAERLAVDESVKRKIRHYKRGLEEVVQHLISKEAALDQMIATGRIPYGTIW